LESKLGVKVELKPGRMGQFDVVVAGRLLFSKKQTGRFPGLGEVEERIAQFKAGKEFPEAATVGGNGGLMGRLLAKLLG
jgi:predicted Rdx family selenoprotein